MSGEPGGPERGRVRRRSSGDESEATFVRVSDEQTQDLLGSPSLHHR